MSKTSGEPVHPGVHVRFTALTPRKISVTEAAKTLGVGRPALSNFLNGKAAATPGMASRIERAFGISAQRLLDMQAAFEAAQARVKGAPAETRAYVPPFLSVKAREIEAWASNDTTARDRFSVLLRTLVNSTGVGLSRVDFPGNDDAQRPGWDGFVEATHGTPWIPAGISGWEFGTNKDRKAKADSDFAKSVKAESRKSREQMTFVFVTPRKWPEKGKWTEERKAQGQWKDVRAYDASDVEQWLEQSIPGQSWFAAETDRASQGVRSLDRCWSDWANVADPPLTPRLFAPTIELAKRTIESYLSSPPERPTLIASDSIDEALAFLSQIFDDTGGALAAHRDRVVVFDEPNALPMLAQGGASFIAVVTSRAIERELARFARSLHSIVLCPRNAPNAEPDVVLEPLHHEAFHAGLEEMGYGRDDIDRLGNESGCSLTVLRRRLSTVSAVRTPAWASEDTAAIGLIPFMFVGAWSAANKSDQTALTLLADESSYETLEKRVHSLSQVNDPPVWSVGTYRGVVSKIDLLFAAANHITPQDLWRYLDIAKVVLSEDDPRLDLPESQRWAASLHGKSREFSGPLREGISETLVLLAVYGNQLFGSRLGFDAKVTVARLVRELLKPLTTRTLEANDRDLPTYAEAAPEEFLSILEEDLGSATPASVGLMRPANPNPLLGGCARTGLLWALETLAWNPTTLPRAVLILGQLAEIEINDNWANKPISSLQSIFRAWMPQTAADHSQCVAATKLLAQRSPGVAWKVCIDQFRSGAGIGRYNNKPRWRTDAHGFGEPLRTRGPIVAFAREMIEMALAWEGHTREMLGDLVARLQVLDEGHQAAVWSLVDRWASAGASDRDKAWLREKIRVSVLSRRATRQAQSGSTTSLETAAKAAYRSLEPSDLFSRHEWLFRDSWVEESADEIHQEATDLRAREGRVAALRVEALREIVAERGWPAVIEFAQLGKAAARIGHLMATEILPEEQVPEFLIAAMPPPSPQESWVRSNLVHGALSGGRADERGARVLHNTTQSLSEYDKARLLTLAPFSVSTWQLVDELPEGHRQSYWKAVSPNWFDLSDGGLNEAVRRLLAAERPRAAFSCVHHKLGVLEPRLLFRLVSDVASGGANDKPGEYLLEGYYTKEAFSLLNQSTEFSVEEMARLELAYIDALARPWEPGGYGIPNLERYVEKHPELFVQAVAWTYRRNDGGEDPNEWKVAPADVQHFAERGHGLLEGLHRIPGCDNEERQTESLAAWASTVRAACSELGRREVGDVCIGRLFSAAPEGDDGVWPCEPVREVIEDLQSTDVCKGARTGLRNARGAHWRPEGGGPERQLAEKYRAWAGALQYSHPFLSSNLLFRMAETYGREAEREDTEAEVTRRLR